MKVAPYLIARAAIASICHGTEERVEIAGSEGPRESYMAEAVCRPGSVVCCVIEGRACGEASEDSLARNVCGSGASCSTSPVAEPVGRYRRGLGDEGRRPRRRRSCTEDERSALREHWHDVRRHGRRRKARADASSQTAPQSSTVSGGGRWNASGGDELSGAACNVKPSFEELRQVHVADDGVDGDLLPQSGCEEQAGWGHRRVLQLSLLLGGTCHNGGILGGSVRPWSPALPAP
jgi:hypothetical protein